MFINSTAEASETLDPHKSAMDRMYRLQRHIYDATRAYYLLGRDRLIEQLDPPDGCSVLEIGCGTGRNIVKAAQRYPGVTFYGVDISDEMLKSATASVSRYQLVGRVKLAQADALTVNGQSTFGHATFDRIYFSYTLSMIPDWQGALARAVQLLAPQGELHIVDFGQCERLPYPSRSLLQFWLSSFHVSPRKELPNVLLKVCNQSDKTVQFESSHRGYVWRFVIKPAKHHRHKTDIQPSQHSA